MAPLLMRSASKLDINCEKLLLTPKPIPQSGKNIENYNLTFNELCDGLVSSFAH